MTKGRGWWSVTQITWPQTVHSPLYFRKIVEVGRPSWMAVKSTWGAVDGLGRSETVFFLFSRLPPPTPLNPDAHPLGTYETKMVARTSERLILTILRENSGL